MFDEARFDRLVSAYFDRQLTAEEKRELETMLLASSKARQRFLEQSDWHGLVREQALRTGTAGMWDEAAAPPMAAAKVIRFPRRAWLTAGLAACAALGLWWLSSHEKVPGGLVDAPVAEGEEVALLGQAVDVEWDGPAYVTGSALPKGMLKIRRGTLRLDFYSGARVVLEGPAELELLSPELARLDRGKLTAQVPPPAEGFTVLNGNLRVIDRGTEFGMSVEGEDHCEVHVFDGEVELQGSVPDATARELFEGDAVTIRDGKSTAFPADRGSFADPSLVLQAAERAAEARRERWRTASQALSDAPGLRVYFDFEQLRSGGMILPNRASDAEPHSDGSVIGCERLSGRWEGKSSLGFARTSDRVRFRTTGTSPSLTLMAWVRVDSLPLDHNALLSMAPGEIGEVHWKLDRAGRLLLGLRASPELAYQSWERLESDPVVMPAHFGRWMHLATVIDGERGEMGHFVNGELVASAPLTRRVPVQLGLANLGNFDPVTPSAQEGGVVRSFNGRVDEFTLFTRALTAKEIAAFK